MTRVADRVNGTVFVLQGPVGPYFAFLSNFLRAKNFRVIRFNFNISDIIFGYNKDDVIFRGDLSAWEKLLVERCKSESPQAMVMFGDCRPVHQIASRIAHRFGIRVLSFEEGYLRPDFVTLEEYGNNSRSRFPREPAFFDRVEPPAPPAVPVGPVFGRLARWAILYFVALSCGRPIFPKYRHHRDRPVIKEAVFWTRGWLRRTTLLRRDNATVRALASSQEGRFFVVALQVHDDLQLICHGRGWSAERLIRASMESFAKHAPRDASLVIRTHPMDRGHGSFGPLVHATAAALGISDRVRLMYNGSGPILLAHAAGCVTINSTIALSAMHHGCPVFALGEAFYRVPGLVHPGDTVDDLDRFWTAPQPVDLPLFRRFQTHLQRSTQINGSFYAPSFFGSMSAAVVDALNSPTGAATPPPEHCAARFETRCPIHETSPA
jgi:capsular polysaccharide export protein